MSRASVVVILTIAACGGKETDLSIAEVVQVVAHVERGGGDSTVWSPAKIGDRLALGNAIRTGPASHARLSLAQGGVLELDANAVVRFVDRPDKTGQRMSDLQVEAGNVEVEAGDQQIGIGEAKLERRGKVRLSARDGMLDIQVTLGNVIVESEGKTVAVEAGKSVTVKIGYAVLEATRPAPRDAATAVADSAVPEVPEADSAKPAGAKMTVRITGKPARIQTDAGERALAIGEHKVEVGALVMGVAGTVIEVVADSGRAIITGRSEIQVGGPVMITAVTGTVVVYASGGEAVVSMPGGSVGARDGGEIRGQIGARGVDVEVRRGEGMIRSKVGEELLKAGDRVVLKPDGTVDTVSRAPASVVFSIPAGESAVVHDVAAPTAIGIRFGGCGGEGVVEVSNDRTFKRVVARTGGRTAGNILVAPGTQIYRVSCEGGKVLTGNVSIVRDSGRKPLPKVAPRTLVDADGREYMITYQNLLPEISLSWRDAPARSSYQFMIQSPKGDTKKLVGTAPRLALKAGDLGEGTHKFWVEIPETGGRSETTRIVIDFDNAQATASIERVDVQDGKVSVKGSVIAGSSVSSGGTAIALDRHLRFETQLSSQAGETGVAVRIAHPKLGVHYYVVSSNAK